MRETTMMFGFLWAGILAVCVLGYVVFRVLDRIERWKQARRDKRIEDVVMRNIRALPGATLEWCPTCHGTGRRPDWQTLSHPLMNMVCQHCHGSCVLPMVVTTGDTDQEIIAHLTGETKE